MCVKGSGVDQLAPRRGATERRAIPSVCVCQPAAVGRRGWQTELSSRLPSASMKQQHRVVRRDRGTVPFLPLDYDERLGCTAPPQLPCGVEWLLCDSVEELFPNPD